MIKILSLNDVADIVESIRKKLLKPTFLVPSSMVLVSQMNRIWIF